VRDETKEKEEEEMKKLVYGAESVQENWLSSKPTTEKE